METEPRFFTDQTKSTHLTNKTFRYKPLLAIAVIAIATIGAVSLRSFTQKQPSKKIENISLQEAQLIASYFVALETAKANTQLKFWQDSKNYPLEKVQPEFIAAISAINPPPQLAVFHRELLRYESSYEEKVKPGDIYPYELDVYLDYHDLYYCILDSWPPKMRGDIIVLTPEWHDQATRRLKIYNTHKVQNGDTLRQFSDRQAKRYNIEFPKFNNESGETLVTMKAIRNNEEKKEYKAIWKVNYDTLQLEPLNLDAQFLGKATTADASKDK